MLYRLIVLSGQRKGERITVGEEPMTIGRDARCEICIDDADAALRHARIEQRGEDLRIKDLDSMGKIIVNNREVSEAKLKHGDVIVVGRTRFLVETYVEAEVERPDLMASLNSGVVALSYFAIPAAFLALVAVVENAWLGIEYSGRKPFLPSAGQTASEATGGVVVASTGLPAPPRTGASAAVSRMQTDGHSSQQRDSGGTVAESAVSGQEKPAKSSAISTAADSAAQPVIMEKAQAVSEASPPQQGGSGKTVVGSSAVRKEMPVESGPVSVAAQPSIGEKTPAVSEASLPEQTPGAAQRGASHKSTYSAGHAAAPTGKPQTGATADNAVARLTQPRSAPPAEEGLISIESADHTRFQESDEFDEMRVVEIRLKRGLAGGNVATDAVTVDLTFFDLDVKSGKIVPSRAVVSKPSFPSSGTWRPGEVRTLTGSYVVPKGFRQASVRAGREEQFYGYVVRVYYKGALQDEEARPRSLLNVFSGNSGRVSPAGAGTGSPAGRASPPPEGAGHSAGATHMGGPA